jgi:hypothetical protein
MKKVFSTSKLRLISQSFFIFLASVLLLLCGYLLRAENLGIWSLSLIVLGVATLLLIGGMVVVFIREQIRYDHFQQEFLTIALHKFRTPLTGIKWAAKSLLKPMTSTELTYISQEINNAGERLIEIVEILSHIEGIENTRTNKFEAVSVREIVEKSAAITVGATFLEIRLSGFILGLFCIFLMFLNVDALARKVPVALIHQLQLGLGILLIFQGIKSKFDILVFLVAGGMFFSPSIVGIPLLGLLATVGLLMAVFHIQSPKDSLDQLPLSHALSQDLKLRAGMIVSLLLPQIPLTLTNSVLATQNIAQRTFGVRAEKVTIRNLLGSINFLNAGCISYKCCLATSS